jgi:hypothetical protein
LSITSSYTIFLLYIISYEKKYWKNVGDLQDFSIEKLNGGIGNSRKLCLINGKYILSLNYIFFLWIFTEEKRRKKIKLATFYSFFLSVYLTCLHPKWGKISIRKLRKIFLHICSRKVAGAERNIQFQNGFNLEMPSILRISRTSNLKCFNKKRIRII